MLRRCFSIVLLVLLVLGALPVFAAAGPRLVVVIIADQMRADYIPRFEMDFSTRGFRRLMHEGIYFSSAAYDYGATKTGPGHALIGSGTYPSENGIVGNEWFDRASSQTVACGDLAPSVDGRTALAWYKGKSFAQRFHAVYPQGRIYGVSHKARSALLLGGPGQDDAFWWDSKEKRYRAFGPDPQWLKKARPGFPRPTAGGEDVDVSILAVTRALMEAEHLGANPSGQPDVLMVSFSEIDYVGHQHGPDAPETRMAVVRFDRLLGHFLDALEAQVGKDHLLLVMTSDHGVTPIPEIAKQNGLSAGRVKIPLTWLTGWGIVQTVRPPFIYLNENKLRERGISLQQAEQDIKRKVLAWEGVQAVYTEAEILNGQTPALFRRSIDTGRSGDLYVVLKPRYIFSEKSSGTTHGQPTPDDQNVPLIFWGQNLKPEVLKSAVSPAAIAPTLLEALHVPATNLRPSLLKKLSRT